MNKIIYSFVQITFHGFQTVIESSNALIDQKMVLSNMHLFSKTTVAGVYVKRCLLTVIYSCWNIRNSECVISKQFSSYLDYSEVLEGAQIWSGTYFRTELVNTLLFYNRIMNVAKRERPNGLVYLQIDHRSSREILLI